MHHLPSTSQYMAAVAADREVAARIAALPDSERPAPAGPSLTDFSPTVAQLTTIADTLLSLRALFLNAHGVKVAQPKPQQRPRTAMAEHKLAARKAKHDALVSRWGPAPASS